MQKSKLYRTFILCLFAVFAMLAQNGCGRKSDTAAERTSIQNQGSDTMVNLAQAWAETYTEIDSTVSIEVSGGGSGTGIAALINGTVDIANSSRKLEEGEKARAQQNTGKEPQEYMVGYDAMAIFVHKNNPLEEITLEQLADIYGESAKITKWSQLGVQNAGCAKDEIIRVSRQNNSGTYHYFRETVLGKGHDFKLGSVDMNGSKDVVELVSKTPCAIGYSGMGYATDEVKMLHVTKKKGEPAYAPTLETALNHTYPISRPLYMYTSGEPSAHVKKYLDWLHSDAGQKIVEENGYVPLPKDGSLSGETPAKATPVKE